MNINKINPRELKHIHGGKPVVTDLNIDINAFMRLNANGNLIKLFKPTEVSPRFFPFSVSGIDHRAAAPGQQ